MKAIGVIPLIYFLVLFEFNCSAQSSPLDFSDYNIVWTAQSKNSAESMPVGGGDIGCNVWVENGELLVYVQRSGSLAETNEYLKLGRLRLKLSPNPFSREGTGHKFRQELKLYDGYIEIIGGKTNEGEQHRTKINLWVDTKEPVVHLGVESNKEINVDVAYENWRTGEEILPNNDRRHSTFTLHAYPGKVILSKDMVEQHNNGIVFYHRNPDNKILPDLLIAQQNLEKYRDQITDDLKGRTFGGMLFGDGFSSSETTTGEYQGKPFRAWHMVSKTKRKNHHIQLAAHVAQTKSLHDWKKGLDSIVAKSKAQNREQMHEASKKWWHQFWSRSYILVNPETPSEGDKAWVTARNYQLFRYQLGCNVSGEYPTKFNGGNFTFDSGLIDEQRNFGPDYRAWGGGVFTAQNQRLLHWPMLKSGDFDAMLPHFELFRKALPGAKARVKEHFGHDGAVYSEYTNAAGLALGAGYGWSEGPRKRGTEVAFGDPRADGSKAYNDLVEKGVMANGSIAYHWESQIENAYMILEYHRFTGADISEYMPFIEQSLLFFYEHYRLRQKIRNGKAFDENGKLVIFPSTSCESYRGAKNPVDVLSGLKACLKSMLKLEEKYLSSDKKKYYSEFLNSIPDYAFDTVNGSPIIKPAESWIRESNLELPQFYPLFPFNQFKIGDTEIEAFKNSYEQAPAFRKGIIKSWHQDGLFLSRMGMTQEAMEYNIKKLADSQRRYPTFWGPGHDWVPDHNWGGSGMIGLQEMLMQCFGDEILLFPAWPKTWNVNFKLHAPKNTLVEGIFKDGTLVKLDVSPESRRKDIRIMNQE
ncbi:DUF5703 domain-containing protein [Ulvibacterium sp.]|uniref:DUF5703 domain-containing protein n=1 Tax=Ulvibacterium sp. TaxID=2665914 RepID=UPI003BA8ED40